MSRFNESFSVPVGIKGTFWALIDFSLFAIGPNLHCSGIFCPLHWFLFLWLAIIDHTLHIWSTLLFHFWIRTDWNFLEVINGIISLFYYMITLWPILVHNLGWIPWKWVRVKYGSCTNRRSFQACSNKFLKLFEYPRMHRSLFETKFGL